MPHILVRCTALHRDRREDILGKPGWVWLKREFGPPETTGVFGLRLPRRVVRRRRALAFGVLAPVGPCGDSTSALPCLCSEVKVAYTKDP